MLAKYDKDNGFSGLLFSLKDLSISGEKVADFFENKFSVGMIKTTTNVKGLGVAIKTNPLFGAANDYNKKRPIKPI